MSGSSYLFGCGGVVLSLHEVTRKKNKIAAVNNKRVNFSFSYISPVFIITGLINYIYIITPHRLICKNNYMII